MVEDNGRVAVVTGINGYIASVIGIQLLELGYTLRGTARSIKSTEPLQNDAYKAFGSRFQPFEVPDMLASGAFDAVVKGAHIIIHCASPITFGKMPWIKFRDPAVKGTTAVLASAVAHAGPQLQSVVVTSSVVAIVDRTKGMTYTNTEKDWSAGPLEEIDRLGDEAHPGMMYAASKILAEKAVWQWVNENQPRFAVTCVQPTVVIGPPIQPPRAAADLNTTLKPMWAMFSGEAKDIPTDIGSGGYVDVRDTAKIHIWCAEHPEKADRQRWIACAGHGANQAQADILRKAYPERETITKGTPGAGYLPSYYWAEDSGPKISGEKARAALQPGFEYIGLKQSVLDTAKVLEKYL